MIEIHQRTNIIYMTAKGKLGDSDYDKLLPILRDMMDEYGEVRWFIKLKDFEGWTTHAFWRDISFALSHNLKFEKVAIVGENKWQEVMA